MGFDVYKLEETMNKHTRSILVFCLAIVTVLASGCGAVTPIVPTPTVNPTISFLMKSSAATKTAFEGDAKKVCSTATPEPQNQVSLVLSDSQITREFAGVYIYSTKYWIYSLVLNCDGTMIKSVETDTGGYFVDERKTIIRDGQILLESSTIVYIPVRWGQRKYLIEEDRVTKFCEATQSTGFLKEPREGNVGFFYLRKGDFAIIATGIPILPSGEKLCP